MVNIRYVSRHTAAYFRYIPKKRMSCLFFQFAMQYANQVKAVRSVSNEKMLAFQANSYIRAHIYEKLTTSIVAAGLNYSVSYLCAAFKQKTGVTLTDYIQQEKISQARYLLEQHKKPADVSRLLEFSSPSYFGTVFRKLVGVSPGEYAVHAYYDFQANGHPFAWNPKTTNASHVPHKSLGTSDEIVRG